MRAQTFDLPSAKAATGRILWHLDARGLEWTGADGKESWMPFACVRRATLGNPSGFGWRLRMSGPPGAALIEAGRAAKAADTIAFTKLSVAAVEGVANAGCGTRFAINHGRVWFDPLWARRGRAVSSGAELIEALKAIS